MEMLKKNQSEQDIYSYNTQSSHVWKFVILSLIGAILFLAPVPHGETFSIPLGVAISWTEDHIFPLLSIGEVDLGGIVLTAVITISAIMTVIASVLKIEFKNPTLQSLFRTTPLYFITRIVAVAFVWMIQLQIGPEVIIHEFTGGVMMGVATHLVAVFFILGFAMPILTDFGIMEFVGILISKIVRAIFTLPGRSSINLMASWLGSSTAAIILTKGELEKGYYTKREAAVISVNFALVSLPFSFVIAGAIGIEEHFPIWYAIICIVVLILGIIMPRIWPLRGLSDEYVEGVKPQVLEGTPQGVSMFSWATKNAAKRASETSFKDVIMTGLDTYANIFLDLLPLVLAWGTISLAIFEYTDIFEFIAAPLGWYMQLFNIEAAMQFAPSALIGFLDMYLPALTLGDAPVATQFIIGALSIVQIIYMTETGILIAKSKMPLNLLQLFVIFLIRTIIAIPIIVGLTMLLTNL